MTLEELQEQVKGLNPRDTWVNIAFVGEHPLRKPYEHSITKLETKDDSGDPVIRIVEKDGRLLFSITHKAPWTGKIKTDVAEFPSLDNLANFVEVLRHLENNEW